MEFRRPTTITLKDARRMEQNQNALADKSDANHDAGRNAYRMGTVEVFDGYSAEPFTRVFQTRLDFDDKTKSKIEKRVIEPLTAYAKKRRLEFKVAGVDLEEAHVSLHKARFDAQMSPEEVAELMEKLKSNSKLTWVAKILTGREIIFNDLTLTKGAIILNARIAQALPLKTRDTMDKVLGATRGIHGLSLEDSRDITHMTLARMTAEPANRWKTNGLYKDMGQVKDRITHQPIVGTIANVSFGTTYEFVQREKPELFKNNSSAK